MEKRDVIDIGLRVIKRCGMYSEEYKGWIMWENELSHVTKMVKTFKNYWSKAITLVNQMASPAIQHNYSMTAMDNNGTGASYGESIPNFGAAYVATQETMKGQSTSLALIQDQLVNLQQFCMAVASSLPAISTLPPSSSVPSTVEEADATEEEAALAVDTLSHNNQPTMDLEVELPEVEPCVPLRPTSDMRTGITATPMAETWTTPTPVKRAPSRVQGTTQT
jgi:hypothetical protein